jgi:hypothetical protein
MALLTLEQLWEEFTLVNVLIGLALAVVVIPFGVWSYDKYRFRKLPPSPPTRPFIGNKHLIPASRPWLKMAEWSEQYVSYLLSRLALTAGSDLHFVARTKSNDCHFGSCYRPRIDG